MRTIKTSIQQALTGRGFLVAAAGTALVLLLSSIQGMLDGFRMDGLLQFGYHSDLIDMRRFT